MGLTKPRLRVEQQSQIEGLAGLRTKASRNARSALGMTAHGLASFFAGFDRIFVLMTLRQITFLLPFRLALFLLYLSHAGSVDNTFCGASGSNNLLCRFSKIFQAPAAYGPYRPGSHRRLARGLRLFYC